MKKINKLLLIIICTLLISAPSFAQEEYKEITVEDLWVKWSFWPNSVYGVRSMKDGIHYTTLTRNGTILKYSYKTGAVVDTVFNASVAGINANDYEFNNDETKILLQTDYKRIYRRSFTAEYYVYEITTDKLYKVSENGKQQIATFSPDSEKIAFIRQNNIFIKDLKSGEERQITTDGAYNKIINGIPDWVYEEEFEFNKAYEWSPGREKNSLY
jgi:dipeptidyl-peptidase-4